MFVPIFTLNLNQKALPSRVAVGEYDGQHACLTAATTAEKVFIKISNKFAYFGHVFFNDFLTVSVSFKTAQHIG